MCHSGARNVNEKAGTQSKLVGKIKSYWRLIPKKTSVVYKGIVTMSSSQVKLLNISDSPLVIPGGHDTCLSHIPVMSTFYQVFPERAGKPVIHIDAGTWTMAAQVGGHLTLPDDGYLRDIIVQGTVDGESVVTTKYGGGSDFKYVKGIIEKRGHSFDVKLNLQLLKEVIDEANCFILPNIYPNNYKTGPFPDLKGRMINEEVLFGNFNKAYIVINFTTSITTAYHIGFIANDNSIPIVLTAGGSKDPYFGRLLATLTKRKVYGMFDKDGNAVSETTTLGAAIAGKAAYLNIHPYDVNVSNLGISYKEYEPFKDEIAKKIEHYRVEFMRKVNKLKVND
jgi:sugar (pentulose or hexulose) kinase